MAWLASEQGTSHGPKILFADAAACFNEAGVQDVEGFVAMEDDRLLSLCTESTVAQSLHGRRLRVLMQFLLHGRPHLLEAARKASGFNTLRLPRTHLANYLDRFLPHITLEQRANIRSILQELPFEFYQRRALNEVCAVAERIPSREAFVTMDHQTLQNVTGCTKKRGGYLLDAKQQPALDPGGQFTSHLYRVRRGTMEQNPPLWKYPANQILPHRRTCH